MPCKLLCLALLAPLAFAEGPAASDPYRLRPDHERTPFSAAELRAGCRPGRVTIFRMKKAGGGRMLQVFKIVKADDKGADLEISMLSPDAKKRLSVSEGRNSWVEIQSQASFPKDQTSRSESRIETPGGTFDCWQYLVVSRTSGKTSEKRYWFAKRLAGPPVKFTIHVNGKKQFEMMLVEHRDGNESALLKAMGFKGVPGATEEDKAQYAREFATRKEHDGSEADYVEARVREAEAKTVFKAMDKDADGKLTRKEFVKSAGISDPGTASRAFTRLDRNADGSVTREEFLKVLAGWIR